MFVINTVMSVEEHGENRKHCAGSVHGKHIVQVMSELA